MRRTYVGYDLGDGETITDVVTLEAGKSTSKTVFDNMTMPDTINPGQAMPTIFAFDETGEVIFSQTISADPEYVHNITANFKKRPSTLLLPSNRTESEQLSLLKNAAEWLDESVWAEGNSDEILDFKNAVVTFTNAIFSDTNYVNGLKSVAQNSDKIVFCVGHPTNWSELDVAIYELVLKSSILGSGIYQGIKSQLLIECEAEAVLYYLRNIGELKRLPRDYCTLIVDAGASTVEVTTISHKVDFYAGTDYLGARNIDFMIRDWYLEKIKQQPAMWSMYQTLAKANPTIPNALTLSCRKAKEQLYSSPSKLSVINFGLFPGIRLTEKDLDKVIEEIPIAEILKETINLNDMECTKMGNKSWKTLFRDFLVEKKAEMTKQGIKVGCIILTGSASKMPFVPRIILEVFNEVSAASLKYDMDPSRTVSKGLALANAHRYTPPLVRDICLIEERIGSIIERGLPVLLEDFEKIISPVVGQAIRKRIDEWKTGEISTLDQMNNLIKEDLTVSRLSMLLLKNHDYCNRVKIWVEDNVCRDISIAQKELLDKYGIKDIIIDEFNTFMDHDFKGDSECANLFSEIARVLSEAVDSALDGILSDFSEWSARSLFVAFVMTGPYGRTMITAIVGLPGVQLLGYNDPTALSKIFIKNVKSWSLPALGRKLLTESRIETYLSGEIYPRIQEVVNLPNSYTSLKTVIDNYVSVRTKEFIEYVAYAIEAR